MSDSEAVAPDDWSALGTVTDFDIGFETAGRDLVSTSGFARSSANSIFVESLIDQLCKFLEKDPLRQRKIYEVICAKLFEMKLIENTYPIEELASLRGVYQQALVSWISTDSRIYHQLSPIGLEWSRYKTEYEEICFLAAGGFGKVFKAKHRLDQVVYAVKKISLKYQNVTAFVTRLSEVKTLAKLNHPNIVQYKAAWLEPLFNVTHTLPPADVTTLNDSDSDGIIFKDSNSSSSSSSPLSSENKEVGTGLVVCEYKRSKFFQQKSISQVGALLYLSMQLCDETLREWLNKRNAFKALDITLSIAIMIQATSGVEYIHSCNIVHHDIKPSNIFVSCDLKSVQVGDFGLSCCLQGHNHADCPLEGGNFGTPLYAAPEQLKGRCNPKSDMFSLGLVLIELVTTFSTEMERVKVLNKVRSGSLPPSIPLELVPLVAQLTSLNPDERPTASELVTRLHRFIEKSSELKHSLSVTKTRIVSFSEDSDDVIFHSHEEAEDVSLIQQKDEVIKDKDREINELKRLLAQRDDEIAKLKQSINSS